MTKIIDGKAFAATLRLKFKEQVKELAHSHQLVPGLAVVLVGADPASEVYVRNKNKQAAECGMNSFEYKLDSNASEAELLNLITLLNERADVHGILVQLPLPKHINSTKVLNHIDPIKDVDGFHPVNVGKLSIGQKALVPCTPLGCTLLLKSVLLKSVISELTGKHAVIIGRSNIVGKPMAQLLLAEDCSVTLVHSRSKNIEQLVANADIVIAAVGRAKMVKSNWIKQGAVLIDVGINRIIVDDKTRLVGDIDFDDCFEKAAFITPVPGGVGPMTIACLLRNTISAYCMQYKIIDPNS
ncbi:5,10-methylene-tetrahydrofolate dehydrogenase [Gammaproteobacteria bacterium]|nr:5,10-methylene-tetrahydrofolate dehydrogenase [Gammaproteobacteria bacterium]